MSETNVSQAIDLPTRLKQIIRYIQYSLPEGQLLPTATWQRRHQGIIVLLWLHALGLLCFGLINSYGLLHSLMESGIVALAAVVANSGSLSRRLRSSLASLGLITASGVLVHLSGGYIEMHFHFFVMIIIISLYQDWLPFLLTIGYVVLHHGVLGVLDPTSVYNHPDAWAHPWKWALIHALFVLGASVASLVNWRLTESMRTQSELLLNTAGEGIYGVDREGKTAFANPVAAALLGWQPEELVGLPMHAVLLAPPDQPTELSGSAAISRALREGLPQHREITQLARRDGTIMPIEYVCVPIRERGQIMGAVFTFQDISERQRAQEEKLGYLEERKQAQEQIIGLQQSVIADLSTPLIPIDERVVVMPLIGAVTSERGQPVDRAALTRDRDTSGAGSHSRYYWSAGGGHAGG